MTNSQWRVRATCHNYQFSTTTLPATFSTEEPANGIEDFSEHFLYDLNQERPRLCAMIDVRKKPTRPQRPGVSVLLLALIFAGCQSDAAPAAEGDFWRPPPLTGDATEIPDARAIVRRMTAFMSGHEQVAFEAFVTFGAVQASGQKLHFDLLQRMAIQKPNKLFWVTIHDNATADSAWLDAGKFRMIKQPANAWGEVDLPFATIVATLVFLATRTRRSSAC